MLHAYRTFIRLPCDSEGREVSKQNIHIYLYTYIILYLITGTKILHKLFFRLIADISRGLVHDIFLFDKFKQ